MCGGEMDWQLALLDYLTIGAVKGLQGLVIQPESKEKRGAGCLGLFSGLAFSEVDS
jgi:hypothetical protein